MNYRYLSVAALLLSTDYPVLATELEPIVITASRTAQTVDQTLSSVSVITREEIERQQPQSIQDLLRGVPGVNLSNNGGLGKASSMFLRGTESDHLLVLIDGIKTGSATLGSTAFEHIPVEQIERIEIVRGPRSSLYGSEAIGGVIQIFTRKGGGSLTPHFSLGGGRYQSTTTSAGLSGGGQRGWFSLNLSRSDTAGFNACDGKPSPDGAGCFTIEPDRDGYNNHSTALRAGYRFDSGLELDTHALRTTGKSEFDGDFVNASKSVQQVVGGSARYALRDDWELSLSAGQNQDQVDSFKESTFLSRFDTVRDVISVQSDHFITPDHLLTVGFDYQDDRVGGNTAYAVDARDNHALFTQYQGMVGNHNLEFSLRRDKNEQFGVQGTGTLAWGFPFNNTLQFTASYGSAFKAPTFNELYYPFYGNPNLQPEESRSLELGMVGTPLWGEWSLNLYENRIDQLIAFDASTFSPANIDRARIRGIEAVLTTRLERWDLHTNLTLLEPKNRANSSYHNHQLPRRSRHYLRFDADRDYGAYRIGATLVAVGKRYEDLANTQKLGGYATLDLRGEYLLAPNWKLQARLENLFDKDYETAAYYNQPGRTLFLTLRYQPQ